MGLKKFALLAAAFALAAPVVAETHVEPAVQPGGDIPRSFHPLAAPLPKSGDIPRSFTPARGDFQYVRRELMIPMRDGAKLYTVLIIPKGRGPFPIMLDRTPYSADKATVARRLRPVARKHPVAALRRAGSRRLHRRVRGRARQI